jgi:hypothetical protein
MEAGNFHRTINSGKVSGKGLKDKGATEEPLPFLKSIICKGDYRIGSGSEPKI